MKREDFVAGMNSSLELSFDERADILCMSEKACSKEMKQVVIMEELAELQQEISKQIRGEGNFYDLLQEIADVDICIVQLLVMYNIGTDELKKAMDVKMVRERDRRMSQPKYEKPELGGDEKC